MRLSRRMTAVAQQFGRFLDPLDVLGDSLAGAPLRQHEVGVVRLIAALVDVEVPALALDDGLPVLDGVEEISDFVARLLSGQLDTTAAELGPELGDYVGSLPVVL